jgi:hypothetical protein
MMDKYYLIITYPGTGTQVLMNTGKNAIASTEDNKQLLISMGKRLLEENIIGSYQLVVTAAPEVNQFTEALSIYDRPTDYQR